MTRVSQYVAACAGPALCKLAAACGLALISSSFLADLSLLSMGCF